MKAYWSPSGLVGTHRFDLRAIGSVYRPRTNPAIYGWPVATFSRKYVGGFKISDHASKPGMVDPQVTWMTAIATSRRMVYTGDRFPQWHGDIFVGGLKSQDIRRIDLDDSGRVVA